MIKKDDMALPPGCNCGDCFAFDRFCRPLGIAKPENTRCDYAPSRFHPNANLVVQLRQEINQLRKQIPPLPV